MKGHATAWARGARLPIRALCDSATLGYEKRPCPIASPVVDLSRNRLRETFLTGDCRRLREVRAEAGAMTWGSTRLRWSRKLMVGSDRSPNTPGAEERASGG